MDLIFQGKNGQLKYEFLIQPSARVENIRLAYRNAENLSLDEAGNLLIQTPLGILTDNKPRSYQEIGDKQVAVESRFVVTQSKNGESTYGFEVGNSYDPFSPLIIDPGLVYSTFLGGSGFEFGNVIALDASGNAYVAGYGYSSDFPTTAGAFDPSFNGIGDVFVAKLDASGSNLVYATYLGGSDGEIGSGIALNAQGNVYITGATFSSDFPIVAGAFDNSFDGYGDTFVAKLNFSGSTLVYATYLGGNGQDGGLGIAVDASDDIYVTGHTSSTDFPTASSFQASLGGVVDAFVAKLVITPQAQIQNIIAGVENLVATGILNQGQGNGLIAKLEAAIQQLDNGNTNAAINQLQSFINQVNDFMSSTPPLLTAAEGQPLIDAANAIIAALSTMGKAAQLNSGSSDLTSKTEGALPTGYRLEQNSPNPFNPVTMIQFSVPRESYVRLKVYNSFGAEIATLVDQQVAAGTYKVNWDASRLASGFYLYRLEAEGFAQTKKLLLMK